jgi:hypothetical protein
LPKCSSGFTEISLGVSIATAVGAEWDGKTARQQESGWAERLFRERRHLEVSQSGTPTMTLTGFTDPFGDAISKAPK